MQVHGGYAAPDCGILLAAVALLASGSGSSFCCGGPGQEVATSGEYCLVNITKSSTSEKYPASQPPL